MHEVGTQVKVMAPFAHDFPNTYTIMEIVVHEDGQIVYILSDDAGGFDPKYLEAV
jgi:hypothetical protein